jgi:hypothetical protein
LKTSKSLIIDEVTKIASPDSKEYNISYTIQGEEPGPRKHQVDYNEDAENLAISKEKQLFGKLIEPLIANGTQVEVLRQSRNFVKGNGSFGTTIQVPIQYDNKFVGGLLRHVKEGIPVIIDENAIPALKQAAKKINEYVLKNNTDIIACQREMIERDLDEYAE